MQKQKDIEAEQSEVDQMLLEELVQLRNKEAKAKEIQPYLIFQEAMLEQMARRYPTTIEQLASLPNISQQKAQKYGRVFIEKIKNYIEKNNIVVPETVEIRANPTKSISI